MSCCAPSSLSARSVLAVTDTRLEREAVGALLADHSDDRGAWTRLKADGWLDAIPDPEGSWPLASVAGAVASVVARLARPLPVGAHLAAAAALVEVGDVRADSDSLAVVTDVSQNGTDDFAGYCWGSSTASIAIAVVGTDLCAVRLEQCTRVIPSVLLLEQVNVSRVSFTSRDIEWLSDVSVVIRRHDGRVAFFLAIEAIAAMQSTVSSTLAFLRSRRQFGTSLGSQQSLQHKAVDMYAAALMGEALAARATGLWVANDGVEASWHAKSFAGERALRSAEQAIQLHGAIGFTWDLDLHLALRRAERARLLLSGQSRVTREVLRSVPAPRDGLIDWSLDFMPERVAASSALTW
jgi:hypothetical protein